jgi:hypothetical protein
MKTAPAAPAVELIQSRAAEVSFPAPVKPQWLSMTDLQRPAKPFENDKEKLDALFNDLDFFVMMAAATDDKKRVDVIAGTVLMVKYNLHRLFYDVSVDKALHPAEDPDFYRALATFERRAGLKVDGKFTVGESERLQFLADLESEAEIGTSPLKSVHGSETYASAYGTWVLQGENIAWPVNRSRIDCWRAERQCTVFTANVSLPRGRKDDVSGPLLMEPDVEYYDIIEWGKTELRARTASQCRQTTLSINWLTEQVHEVTTDTAKQGCPLSGPLTKPRLATLDDQTPIQQFFKSRKEMLKNVSDSPIERIRALLSTTKK